MIRRLIICLFLMLSAGCSVKNDLQLYMLNKQGNILLKNESYSSAQEKYIDGLSVSPFSEDLQINLGLTFEATQKFEAALSSYSEAEKNAQDILKKFIALFNRAQLLGKSGKIDEALDAYQQALKLNPSSKEVKTNIELLIQQQQDQKNKDQKNGDGKGDSKNKDQKDQDQKNKDQKDQDQKNKDDKDQDQKEKNPKDVQKSAKYKPRPYKGDELTEADVKKILGEIRQQEQKIRSEFNKKEVKELPREKDW